MSQEEEILCAQDNPPSLDSSPTFDQYLGPYLDLLCSHLRDLCVFKRVEEVPSITKSKLKGSSLGLIEIEVVVLILISRRLYIAHELELAHLGLEHSELVIFLLLLCLFLRWDADISTAIDLGDHIKWKKSLLA